MFPTQTSSNSNRRYSLFSGSSVQSSGQPLSSLFGSSQNDDSVFSRRTSLIGGRKNKTDMSSVCQRCKNFEVDLTTASDNLSATDTELKASRQVISLLQRQLELLRVEKDGLEKLIVSHSQAPSDTPDDALVRSSQASVSSDDLIQIGNNDGNAKTPGDRQNVLMSLIKEQLYAKDEEIVKLKFALKETQNEKEQFTLQLHLLEEDNEKLKNENLVLSENLTLRDQTIVSLSNEVFEQTNSIDYNSSRRRQSSVEAIGGQQSLIKTQRQMAKLIDTLDAYKKTNELLSNNVMKLTERCNTAEQREVETRSQNHELEAKCCQIQSKLLSLLKEIDQPSQPQDEGDQASKIGSEKNQDVICSDSVKLLIKRLLEDKSLDIPLSWKEGNKPNRNKEKDDAATSSSKYECDELGFYIVADEKQQYSNSSSPIINATRSSPSQKNYNDGHKLETVEEAVENYEQVFRRDSRDETRQTLFQQMSVDAAKSDESRWHLRWDEFIKDFDKIDLAKSKEFKNLLRSGVPQEYRCKVWKSLIELRMGKVRHRYGPDYYQSLLEPNRPQSSSKMAMNASSKQIELDLLRTLPNNRHFEMLDSSGTVRLRRVLTAYSEHNQKVGYCQGMNRLAAVALLVLPEEEAFWCLATIVDNIMPLGYYNDLWLAQVDSTVVMEFVSMKMPDLSQHFKENCIDLSLFAWFLTIFVDGTPPALFLRLWDSFLYEGDKVLFRVALALLKMHEDQLLKLNNSVAVNNFLRSSVNAPMNIDQFFDIAFDWINPLSSRSLRSKRRQNFQSMRSGFECVERPQPTPSPGGNTDEKYRGDSRDDSPYEDSSIISI